MSKVEAMLCHLTHFCLDGVSCETWQRGDLAGPGLCGGSGPVTPRRPRLLCLHWPIGAQWGTINHYASCIPSALLQLGCLEAVSRALRRMSCEC
ncbi:hypothetical protein SKAU_G00317120 [Synaphobranchus kaupii]|uniref:Uncharacterized protein n=1 Tax=Synaphobranchus kaupii TaxID=118154 RepID=A0A9Q1ILM7_SYNKA|nr:hypothetical protein SKAU_G00317120 [Synaphobranchus kaupii]